MATFFRSPCFRVLPLRGLAQTKKKAKAKQIKKQNAPVEVPLAHSIPYELTKETREFFQNQNRFKALLELVFSPREPEETTEDQVEFEDARAEFNTMCERALHLYKAHEARAEQRMWRALQQLPEDLYSEAVASKPERVPEELLFHNRYRKEIFGSLSDHEQRKLQVFHNLMYVRYPHADEKRRNPERFWMPENQIVSRQREAAMAKKNIKPRKG
mmetsp:Transcript_100964/g.140311  ORF Transcript_100964/g.140311 Transcript_100964/m.140311 type:complete len:215 (-) Transcript_100964:23-667(-)